MSINLKPSLNWLLLFVPVAIVLRYWPGLGNDTTLFLCSCFAIIPLAGIIGQATEELASHLGQGIGGLLNATFGNAAELIISLMALSKGLTTVVKASITGSIIGNLLLVLGMSVLAGGIKFPVQRFNKTAVLTSTASLSLAAIALLMPTVFHLTARSTPTGWSAQTEQNLSLAIAGVLFVSYLCMLAFSLVTHKHLYNDTPEATAEVSPKAAKRPAPKKRSAPKQRVDHSAAAGAEGSSSLTRSVVTLLVATAFVALVSEFLVGTVEGARAQFGVTEVFVGIVVVAIVGNAAEHSTAIFMAMKNKMDLSLGIAIGSSLQIALFVAPVLIFLSYFLGEQPMNLEFTIPEVIAVIVSVIVVGQISSDGESNWFEGVQLLAVYLILAILFFYLPPLG